MKDVYIPNGYFHLWYRYICELHLDQILLLNIGEDRSYLDEILNLPLAGQSSHAFFIELIEQTRQVAPPDFIFQMAEYVKAEHFGVLGYMATRSGSVAEALQYILKFSRLVIDGDEITPMHIQQEGTLLKLSWPLVTEEYAWINEITTAMMIKLAKHILPEGLFPLEKVLLAHEPLMASYHYQKFYGCEVLFKHSEYALMLSLGSLALKPQHADPSLIHLLIQQAEDAIASKIRHDSIDQQLHGIVAEYLRLKQTVPKIQDIAHELHVSVRTLQRQLSALNTSFKKIIEFERMARCENLLLQQLSFTAIALALGYSDQSALARAYKSFHGHTLLERKKILKSAHKKK